MKKEKLSVSQLEEWLWRKEYESAFEKSFEEMDVVNGET